MSVEFVELGFQPKGRESIRQRKGKGGLPGDPLMPDPPPSRSVGLWTFSPKPNTTMAKLEAAYLGALEAVDQVEARRAEAEASGRFTVDGVRGDVLQFAASTIAPKLYRHRRTIDEARAEATVRREKLTLPAADKTDAAGQMRRLWKLDRFRALPEPERNSFIAKNLDSLDPELTQAFLEMPEYAGLLPSDLDQIRDRALRAAHGDAFDELKQLSTGIEIADRAVRMAREELAIEAGVDLARFDAVTAPFENAPGPWLKKVRQGNEEVTRVVRWNAAKNGGTLAVPNADEVQRGVFYRDIEEFRAAHGTAA
jgi:hypothetical protein